MRHYDLWATARPSQEVIESLRLKLSSVFSRAHEGIGASLLGFATRDPPGPPGDGHPDDYKLLRDEDYDNWLIFFVVFFVLIIFDNLVLHRKQETPSFGVACLYSLFWVLCAAAFCVYVFYTRGAEDAFDWWTGYMLEWMLSVDNLFVFRSIFCLFKTPDDQKHKPLFWGIVGAVIFRMAFFVVEELLLHSFHWMHFVLGAFLIYTGVKIIFVDDEDEINAEQHPMFLAVTRYVPFVDAYSPNIRFICRVPELKSTGEVYLPDWIPPKLPSRPPSPCVSLNPSPEASPSPSPPRSPRYQTEPAPRQTLGPDSITAPLPEDLVYRYRFTRLFVVVLCLEVTDIIFAVDSVSAIVAQIPDLFLAYTACVFAMLGLRATFFVVDGLVKLFFLLNYAVSGILIFLGVKLLVRAYIHIPPEIVCLVLVTTLSASIFGSIIINKLKGVPICGDERASVSSSKDERGSLSQAEKGEADQSSVTEKAAAA